MAGVRGRSGGQNRKAAELHLLQGTFRPARHTVEAPQAPFGAPDPPATLAGEGLLEWHRMIARLKALGTISTVDGALLECYCRLFGDASRLQVDADRLKRTWFSKTVVDSKGRTHREPRSHPVFAQLKSYRLALRTMLVEFGMTPLSRNRVMRSSAAGVARVATDPKKAQFLDGLK